MTPRRRPPPACGFGGAGLRSAGPCRRWVVSGLAALLLWGGARDARAEEDAENLRARAQSAAYVALIRADSARDQESWKDALAGYQRALRMYETLSQKYPDWQREIVQYRVTYCANQMEAIAGKTGRSVNEWLAAPAPSGAAAEEAAYRQRYQVLREENEYLRKRLAEVEAELQDTEEAALVPETVERLRTENAALRQKMQLVAEQEAGPSAEAYERALEDARMLRSRLASAEQEGAEWRQKAAEQETMRVERDELALRLRAREEQNAALQGLVERMEEQPVDEEAGDRAAALEGEREEILRRAEQLQGQMAEAEAAARDLADENRHLKQRLLVQAEERRAAESSANLSTSQLKNLQKENEGLKGTVTSLRKANEGATVRGEQSAAAAAALERQVQDLRGQLERAARPVAGGASYDEVRAENRALRARLRDVEREAGTLTRSLQKADRDRQELEGLRRERAAMQGEIEALEIELQAAARLRERNQELEAEVRTYRDGLALPGGALSAEAFVTGTPALTPGATDDLRGLLQAALALEAESNYPAAVEVYAQVLARRPGDPEALKAQGRCYLHLGDGEKAMALLQEGVARAPADPALRLLLGMAYCATLRFDEAVEVLSRVAVDDPGNADAHNALGAAWMGLGNLERAREELEQATRLNAELSDAHFNLAQVLCFSSPPDLEGARRHYDQAVQLGAAANPEFENLLR